VSRDRFPHQPTLWDKVRSDGAGDNCFADEIAIDFPSVDRLLERERDAFLGEGGSDTLTTEVLLSHRDASTGIVLPLDVPLRGT
jgi:hypothetical protein